MKKTLMEAQPEEIKGPQDFILTQNPEIRSLLDRDMRAVDVMTFPRLAQEIKTGILFLQTQVQDNLAIAMEEIRNTSELWEKTEEVASEELKNRDPYRKICEKYAATTKYLQNAFAARNIENQFLTNINEKSLAIIEETKHVELVDAEFKAWKDFYEKSMSSRDDERKEFREFAESMAGQIKSATSETMKATLDMVMRMQGGQQQLPDNIPVAPVQTTLPAPKPKPKAKPERPIFRAQGQKRYPDGPEDISFPNAWDMDEKVTYLLTTFAGINKRRVQRITEVPDNIYFQLYNRLRRLGAITTRGRRPAQIGAEEEVEEEPEEVEGEEEAPEEEIGEEEQPEETEDAEEQQ